MPTLNKANYRLKSWQNLTKNLQQWQNESQRKRKPPAISLQFRPGRDMLLTVFRYKFGGLPFRVFDNSHDISDKNAL